MQDFGFLKDLIFNDYENELVKPSITELESEPTSISHEFKGIQIVESVEFSQPEKSDDEEGSFEEELNRWLSRTILDGRRCQIEKIMNIEGSKIEGEVINKWYFEMSKALNRIEKWMKVEDPDELNRPDTFARILYILVPFIFTKDLIIDADFEEVSRARVMLDQIIASSPIWPEGILPKLFTEHINPVFQSDKAVASNNRDTFEPKLTTQDIATNHFYLHWKEEDVRHLLMLKWIIGLDVKLDPYLSHLVPPILTLLYDIEESSLLLGLQFVDLILTNTNAKVLTQRGLSTLFITHLARLLIYFPSSESFKLCDKSLQLLLKHIPIFSPEDKTYFFQLVEHVTRPLLFNRIINSAPRIKWLMPYLPILYKEMDILAPLTLHKVVDFLKDSFQTPYIEKGKVETTLPKLASHTFIQLMELDTFRNNIEDFIPDILLSYVICFKNFKISQPKDLTGLLRDINPMFVLLNKLDTKDTIKNTADALGQADSAFFADLISYLQILID